MFVPFLCEIKFLFCNAVGLKVAWEAMPIRVSRKLSFPLSFPPVFLSFFVYFALIFSLPSPPPSGSQMQLEGLGSAVSSHSLVRGEARTEKHFRHILNRGTCLMATILVLFFVPPCLCIYSIILQCIRHCGLGYSLDITVDIGFTCSPAKMIFGIIICLMSLLN